VKNDNNNTIFYIFSNDTTRQVIKFIESLNINYKFININTEEEAVQELNLMRHFKKYIIG
jgi:arsenate reductase-like glutaredoxin family protein